MFNIDECDIDRIGKFFLDCKTSKQHLFLLTIICITRNKSMSHVAQFIKRMVLKFNLSTSDKLKGEAANKLQISSLASYLKNSCVNKLETKYMKDRGCKSPL
jgi:hypothetical protein